MPFRSQAYIASLDRNQYGQLLADTVQAGTHPLTEDAFLLTNKERQSGVYILGKPDSGKSVLMENMALADIMNRQPLIFLDPHDDSITHCVAQMSEKDTYNTSILDIEDETHPIGLNIFNMPMENTSVGLSRGINRVTHPFESVWPEIFTQQHLPRYFRASVITLFANRGSTLVDMYTLLTDDAFRRKMLTNVKDQSVHDFWRIQYDELSMTDRLQRIRPLLGKLENLFMGRDLIRNILGQKETTIDFRKAIEDKELIFIKLPIKTLGQDARLIGTIIISLIHEAVFSFRNLPEEQRPGVSIYVDEFSNFATPDFSELFTEGRKYGARLTLAHQYRKQLPEFLRSSTLTAKTIVCFQQTLEDAREVAPLFLNGTSMLKPENIDPRPIEYLLKYGARDPRVQVFIDIYLRYMQTHRTGNKVEIKNPGFRDDHVMFWLLSVKPPVGNVEVDNPMPELNHLLYDVMRTGNYNLPISPKIVWGFANCGYGFYSDFKRTIIKSRLLSADIKYPPYLVVETPNGLRWTRQPEHGREQLYHFLFSLRQTMKYLAENPIGTRTTQTQTDIAQDLMRLPKRAAYVKSGQDVGVFYTDDRMESISGEELDYRLRFIQNLTRIKYCTPLKQPGNQPIVQEPKLSRWEVVE